MSIRNKAIELVRSKNVWKLLLISFLTLYFELLVIRWLPTQIRILAYFTNVTLISCILGLGLGTLVAHERKLWPASFYYLFSLLVGLAYFYHGADLQLPLAHETHFIWNGLSRAGRGTPLQYVVMFAFVVLNTALFIPLGKILGREFDKHPAIQAYSINVFGAILGIAAFALYSQFEVTPVVWFLTGIAMLAIMLPRNFWVYSGAVVAVLVALIGSFQPNTHWSPYYRITTRELAIRDGTPVGFELAVNDDSHQQALDLSDRYRDAPELRSRGAIYDEPYRHGPNDDVLVLGAGTGNDVAAALRAGAERVTAVEIDPVILRLGLERHPEDPYNDPRVTLHVADARSFVRESDKKYDKIVLGYLDSHSLFSSMSSLRLDNFIYTEEFFREMQDHLEPDGVIAATFTVHERWIADRIFSLFTKTFGAEPLVYQGSSRSSKGTVFMGGGPVESAEPTQLVDYNPTAADGGYTWNYSTRAGYVPGSYFDRNAVTPTDNWPYLYLKEQSVPLNYLVPLLIMGLFFIVFIGRMSSGLDRIDFHFFFLGAAFLLVETKAITELAIFLGSTWVTNAFVIGMILGLILLANWLASTRYCPPTWSMYVGLGLILLITYLAPIHGLLSWDAEVRNWVAATILCAPLFFAGVIFATQIKRVESPSVALGSNLVGAMVGGILEYTSMVFGFKTLYIVAILLYFASYYFLLRRMPGRQLAID